jgi:hypothetical protein
MGFSLMITSQNIDSGLLTEVFPTSAGAAGISFTSDLPVDFSAGFVV